MHRKAVRFYVGVINMIDHGFSIYSDLDIISLQIQGEHTYITKLVQRQDFDEEFEDYYSVSKDADTKGYFFTCNYSEIILRLWE